MHWILVVIPPYYKNGTNDRTPESHARNDGNTDKFSSLPDGYQRSQGRCQSRRNESQDGLSPQEVDEIMEAGKEKIEAMREACLEKTEVCLESKEPASEEMKSNVEHKGDPKEEAAVWKLLEH
jgi:hypothetical protein